MDAEALTLRWHAGQRLGAVIAALVLGGVLSGLAEFLVPAAAERGMGIGFTVYAWNQLRPGWQRWRRLRRTLVWLPFWIVAGALVGYGVHRVVSPLFR